MLDTIARTRVTFPQDYFDEDEKIIYERYISHIQPFWRTKVIQGVFAGAKGIEISYAFCLHPQSRGSIAISSGRIESLIKYKELVFNLYNAGYSVFIHDHRGQGLSGRMCDNPHQGYVDHFDDYVQDLHTFYQKVIMPNSPHSPMLLCHSMGAAIGTLYLLKYPDHFARAVFSAPMFGIRPAMPQWFARTLLHLHCAVAGLFAPAPHYFLGQGDYQDKEFERNILTHSAPRYALFRQEYQDQPQVQLGGVTCDWLEAALDAMDKIEASADKIATPILLLQAGDDRVVDNDRQDKVIQRFANCQKRCLKGAWHELLMEEDKYRDTCLRAVLSFFIEAH